MRRKFYLVFLPVLILMSGMNFYVSAEKKNYGCFNALSVGAGVGTSGVDIRLAMPIGKYFSVSAEAIYMPGFNLKSRLDATVSNNGVETKYPINLKGCMERFQGGILVNAYPVKHFDLYLTLGVYFGGKTLVTMKGHSDDLQQGMQEADKATIVVGDYEVPVNDKGNVDGGLKVFPVRPYFGVGYGRLVPSNRWGFMIEVGLQLDGIPQVYTNEGAVHKTDIDNVNDKFSKVIDSTCIYPVLKVGFNFRAF